MKKATVFFLIACIFCGTTLPGFAESLEERVSSLEHRVQVLEELIGKNTLLK